MSTFKDILPTCFKRTYITILFSLILCLGVVNQKAHASDTVDLLFVVEPSVLDEISREALATLINEQVDYANDEFSEFDIEYTITAIIVWEDNKASEGLSQGKTFTRVLVPTFYSILFNEEEYNAVFTDQDENEHYDPRAKDLLNYYGADKLVFLTKEDDEAINAVGVGMKNLGTAMQASAMKTIPDFLAHELAHNLAMGHTSLDDCQQQMYLLCDGGGNNSGFTVAEKSIIQKIINFDADFDLEFYHMDHYLGRRVAPLAITGQLRISVEESDVSTSSNSTEVLVTLLDNNGDPYVSENTVSFELFTNAITATPGTHYDKTLQQTLVFAAGENEKRIDVDVTHTDTEVTFEIGAHYGNGVSDSNVETITIEATTSTTPTPDSGSDNGSTDSGDSGGALQWIILLLLGVISLLRTANVKKLILLKRTG
ncbi:SVAGG family GlyGly-CTERM protein [uncultured Shewanella sp.]|uniref:SVAGG family GlyGly-CTERM protein n=1 Tax=uncultured Shewanella sp. TaxID=173975 RepID=UPI002629458D|nr:SVAGG family GlyGly-CTERM protein [uncultured Shewanella sp.]